MIDEKRALLGDHEAATRLMDAGVLVPCMCGRTPKEHGPEDWKPTFYDPDSGGDPVSIECECGINFSIWSYDYSGRTLGIAHWTSTRMWYVILQTCRSRITFSLWWCLTHLT